MTQPSVSIIIPAYNVQKYIERSIKSAIEQTLKDIEIIVVNDGSTDKTRDIIERLAKEDSRIVVINKENGGLSSARNAGIKIAQGEYIQHLDGDDWIEKDACEQMYTYAKDNNLDIVVSDYYEDSDKGDVNYIKMQFPNNDNITTNKEYLHTILPIYEPLYIWNKLIKRELYIDNNIWHPEGISLGEDLATTPRLILMADRIGKIDKAFVHYIVNPLSISKNAANRLHHLYKAHDIIDDFFKDKNRFKEYKEGLEIYRFYSKIGIFSWSPNFDNTEYMLGFNRVLSYFKSKPKMPKSLPLYKKILIVILIYFPSKRYLKFLINLRDKIVGEGK